MIIVCQICAEPIAQADPERLQVPMTGDMFRSPDPVHGFLPPFQTTTEWLGMRCPYCGKRPFILEDQVLTLDGIFVVPSPPVEIVEPEPVKAFVDQREVILSCEVCGREIKGKGPLAAHMRRHTDG